MFRLLLAGRRRLRGHRIFGQSITTFRDDRIIIVINAAWPKAGDRELSAARIASAGAPRR
jgi:hypothetical protein